MLKPTHVIPTDFEHYCLRRVVVELTQAVSFEMHEVLFQRRPNHWARIWPSAVGISRWLLDQAPSDLPHEAKELGCGLGLVSMTLARLGVVVDGTDREVVALAFARRNAERNALVGFSVSHLDWGDPIGEPTGMIVASDILYEAEAPGRLFELLQTSGLLLPGGQLVLAGPRRRSDPLNQLTDMLGSEGYSHREEMRCVEWDGQADEIDIHVLRRPMWLGAETRGR